MPVMVTLPGLATPRCSYSKAPLSPCLVNDVRAAVAEHLSATVLVLAVTSLEATRLYLRLDVPTMMAPPAIQIGKVLAGPR